jgi:hypothetical protein
MDSTQHTHPTDPRLEDHEDALDGRGDGRDESYHERLDRNMAELTGELRVVVTGVQVLFAFLLVVPFNSGFHGIGPFERGVYLVTLVLAALAAACTIAPSAAHRILFRADDKQRIVRFSNSETRGSPSQLAMRGSPAGGGDEAVGSADGPLLAGSRWIVRDAVVRVAAGAPKRAQRDRGRMGAALWRSARSYWRS